MNYELESEIWKTAQRVMSAEDFRDIVVSAVMSYKRLPGYSVFERLHAGNIGIEGVEALQKALNLSGQLLPSDPTAFVSLRALMREHLYIVLQWQLISVSRASAAVIDGHFAGDLGL